MVFTNYVQSMTNFGYDISVIQFSNTFPKQFVPFQLMPTNFAKYLPGMTNSHPNGFKIPVIAGSFDRHLYFMGLSSVMNDPFGGKGNNGIQGGITYDGGSGNGPGRWITNQIGYGWGSDGRALFHKNG
ncbi:MAG: hypothetical protein WDN00_14785 [Limisphaerales bacterium]